MADEQNEDLDPVAAEVERLKAHNAELLKEVKESKWQARFSALAAKHPHIEASDVEGFDGPAFEKIEAILAKTPKPAATEQEPPAPPAEPVTPEDKAEFQRLTSTTGIAPAQGEPLTASQIGEIGRKDPAQALALLKEGRMASP